MRARATIILAVWAAGFCWLGCNALLGNESAVFEPDAGSADVVTTEGGPGETGSVDDGATDGALLDGAQDAASDAGDGGGHPCTTTSSDPFNCGTCGHDCLGGMCSVGVCQPVILATDVGKPTAITVDATHVYWTSSTGDIRRVPIAGGPSELVFHGPTGTYLGEGLVRTGTDLYFTIDDGNADGGLVRCPAAGCGVAGPVPVIVPLAAPEFVAMADGGVLLVSESVFNGRVGKCTLPCTSGLDVIASAEGLPTFVAVEGDSAYWETLVPVGGNLRAKDDLASAPRDLAAGRVVQQVAVLGPDVLFAQRGSGLWEISRDGGVPRKLMVAATDTSRFALDGDDVYFSDEITAGRILRCNVASCQDAGAVIAKAQDHPHAIAVDALNIYWTNTGLTAPSGSIARVAK